MGIRPAGEISIILSACLIALPATHQPQNESTARKIVIPRTDPFEYQVPLPPAVLEALLNDAVVKSSASSMTDYQRSNPSKLFIASEVRLGRPDEVDYIVAGNPPLCGVGSDFYWVVRPTARKPEVIFFGGGQAIEFLESRSHGYRDIRTVGGTIWILEENVYRFGGKGYKVWKKRSEKRQ